MPARNTEADIYRDARALARRVSDVRPEVAPLAEKLARLLRPYRHSSDFASVVWFGERYSFSKSQSAVVEKLWREWLNGTPDVKHETLLVIAGSFATEEDEDEDRTTKLKDLFRSNPAWGTMIKSIVKGTYRLVAPEN